MVPPLDGWLRCLLGLARSLTSMDQPAFTKKPGVECIHLLAQPTRGESLLPGRHGLQVCSPPIGAVLRWEFGVQQQAL